MILKGGRLGRKISIFKLAKRKALDAAKVGPDLGRPMKALISRNYWLCFLAENNSINESRDSTGIVWLNRERIALKDHRASDHRKANFRKETFWRETLWRETLWKEREPQR